MNRSYMDDGKRVRFKDLSFFLKLCTIGGFLTLLYAIIVLLAFCAGIVIGTFQFFV